MTYPSSDSGPAALVSAASQRRAPATRGRAAGARLAAISALLVACAATMIACAPAGPHGAPILPRKRAPEISDDDASRPFRLSEEEGRVVVLSFGYTSCPDVCPTTLGKMRDLYRRLGDEKASAVTMVFVSVDPERDTGERLGEYVSAFDPRIHGVRLTGDTLSTTLRAYGATSERHALPAERYEKRPLAGAYYSIDHTSGYFVIDKAGDLRLRFPAEVSVGDLLSDVLALAAEGDSP